MKENHLKVVEKRIALYGCQQNLFEIDPLPQLQKKDSGIDNYVFDIVDALQGPVLTFSLSWADTIPARLLDIIPTARLKALMEKEHTATYEECVIYIYTRTLEAPMDSEWTDIYTHVACKTLHHWFSEDHWNEVNAPTELNDWLTSKLNGLRRHIYENRREMFKKFSRHKVNDVKNNCSKEKKSNSTTQQDLKFTK